MDKLPVFLSLCFILPLAASLRPERVFERMSGNEVRDAISGTLGLCPAAAQCFEGRLVPAYEKSHGRYDAWHSENATPRWRWVPSNGTVEEIGGTDYAKHQEKYTEFEAAEMGRVIDDLCSALTKAQDECGSKCEVEKDSVYGTLGQPIIDFVCKERIDDVKSAAACVRRLAAPMSDVDYFGQCEPPKELARQWMGGVQEAVRGDEQLKALVDKVLGGNGIAATLCKENACYTDHFQQLMGEHCGAETTVIKDFQSMVTPHLMQIIDGMHIGCLVPESCKEMLPFAAFFALIAEGDPPRERDV